MKKEQKILAEKASDYILNKSSIANSIKVLYFEADSAMLQIFRAQERIKSVFAASGLVPKGSPELGALKNYYTAIKSAQYHFDNTISKMITDATFNANEGENRARSYEYWAAYSNAFAKFSLLFFDRTYRDPEQMKAIFDFISGLESHGQFGNDDFKYFDMVFPD